MYHCNVLGYNFEGMEMTVREYSKLSGISENMIRQRITGWKRTDYKTRIDLLPGVELARKRGRDWFITLSPEHILTRSDTTRSGTTPTSEA